VTRHNEVDEDAWDSDGTHTHTHTSLPTASTVRPRRSREEVCRLSLASARQAVALERMARRQPSSEEQVRQLGSCAGAAARAAVAGRHLGMQADITRNTSTSVLQGAPSTSWLQRMQQNNPLTRSDSEPPLLNFPTAGGPAEKLAAFAKFAVRLLAPLRLSAA